MDRASAKLLFLLNYLCRWFFSCYFFHSRLCHRLCSCLCHWFFSCYFFSSHLCYRLFSFYRHSITTLPRIDLKISRGKTFLLDIGFPVC